MTKQLRYDFIFSKGDGKMAFTLTSNLSKTVNQSVYLLQLEF